MTSRDVVNVVQRRLPKKTKVGHAGTLDPLAEGVLVLGVGPAVRLVPYVQQQRKCYRASFRLGVSSATGDLEGELNEYPQLPIPDRAAVEVAAAGMVGRIEQTPPAHSAIWVDGQRAYKRIRAGERFDMPKRTVEVYELKVLRYEYPELELEISCGSGTYVRTLGLDLAVAAGSTAVMTHLCRTAIGPFSLAESVSLDPLREDDIESMLVSPAFGVESLPRLVIDHTESQRLGHGLCIDEDCDPSQDASQPSDAAAFIQDGRLRAIVRRKGDQWCPYRVFPIDAPSTQERNM